MSTQEVADTTAMQYANLVIDAARALELCANRMRNMPYIEQHTQYGVIPQYERHAREIIGEAVSIVGGMALPTLLVAAEQAQDAAERVVEEKRREAYREAEEARP